MAIYIALGKYTTEGIKAVENAPKRYEKMGTVLK
jgi:uncharacterized protein with GYD domain